jgi:hypothetical protein
MFEQFVTSARGLERYRKGPLAEERERYLTQLSERGHSSNRLMGISIQLLAFAQRVRIEGQTRVTEAEVAAAAESWMKERKRWSSQPRRLQIARTDFVSVASNWLRFLGRLEEVHPQIPFADLRYFELAHFDHLIWPTVGTTDYSVAG